MGQDAHSNGKIIIELFLPYIASFCGFIVILLLNDMSPTYNVQIF